MNVPWDVFLLFVAMFTFFRLCEASEARKDRNRFWWTMNRVRSCILAAGDPGPWRDRTKE